MLEQSIDAQFLKPTVVSMAFGIFFAAFVTLLFVPSMYLLGADITRFMKSIWTGDKQPAVGEGVSKDHGYATASVSKPASDGGPRRNPLVDPAE